MERPFQKKILKKKFSNTSSSCGVLWLRSSVSNAAGVWPVQRKATDALFVRGTTNNFNFYTALAMP